MQNIKSVHNAIDVDKFQCLYQDIRKKLGIDKNEFLILTISRLTQVKGLDILIKGYATFLEKGIPSRLIIVGKGELKNNLIELAEKLGIKKNILFIDFVSNLADYISSCDVFVMTSNYEPFGMTAAEAGVVGKPIIVSKVGGLIEIVEDGKTGFHFEVNNFNELANLFEKLSKNQSLRKELGVNAKNRIIEKFSPEIIAKKFVKIYSELFSENQSSKD